MTVGSFEPNSNAVSRCLCNAPRIDTVPTEVPLKPLLGKFSSAKHAFFCESAILRTSARPVSELICVLKELLSPRLEGFLSIAIELVLGLPEQVESTRQTSQSGINFCAIQV